MSVPICFHDVFVIKSIFFADMGKNTCFYSLLNEFNFFAFYSGGCGLCQRGAGAVYKLIESVDK